MVFKMLSNIFLFFSVLIIAVKANVQAPCEGTHLHFVNDYAGCTRYFSCVNGFPHPVECLDNFHFNKDPLGCFPPGLHECDRCPAEGVHSFGYSGSCTRYTLCINGNAMDRECAPGTRFDWRAGRCDLQERVTCDYLRCPEEGNHLAPDPTSCQYYLVCVNGEEVARRRCAEGLNFDPDLGSCSRNENVACPLHRMQGMSKVDLFFSPFVPTVPTAGPPIPTVPTASTAATTPNIPNAPPDVTTARPPITTTTTTTATTTTTPRVGTPTPPPNIERNWPTGPISCPPTGIHYFGHHLICTVFQVCAHGFLHQVNCPPGQHWSTIRGACEFPDRANCPH